MKYMPVSISDLFWTFVAVGYSTRDKIKHAVNRIVDLPRGSMRGHMREEIVHNAQYSFPLLQHKEIISCLDELGMDATEGEVLSKPSPEVLRPIYLKFVELLMGVDKDIIQEPEYDSVESCMEYPELHDESVGEVAFIQHCGELHHAAGVHDFSIRDIYRPDSQRTKKNLSALINFAKFREEKITFYHELNEQSERLLENRAGFDIDIRMVQKKLEHKLRGRIEENEKCNALNASANQLSHIITNKHDDSRSLHAELRSIKHRISQCVERRADLLNRKDSGSQCVHSLELRIVQSPERLMSTLSNMRRLLEISRDGYEHLETKFRDLTRRNVLLGKIHRDVCKYKSLLDDSIREIERFKLTNKNRKQASEDCTQIHDECRILNSSARQVERQLKLGVDRLRRLQRQMDAKLESSKEILSATLAERSEVDLQTSNRKDRAYENNISIKNLCQFLQEMRNSHLSHVMSTQLKFYNLASKNYHDNLSSFYVRLVSV